MTRTPAQALAAADKMTTGYNGLCLTYVRDSYDIGAKYTTAHDAWEHAEHKHANLDTAPAGAPVFMRKTGDPYDHVGLLTADGRFRSTDSALRHPHTADLSYWTRAGYKILGWTEDLNGVRIKGLTPKKSGTTSSSSSTSKVTVLKLGSKGSKVKKLQQALNATFPAYSKLKVDSSYGPKVEAVVKEFQRRANLTDDGVAGPKTQAALAKYGVEL